jgi:hypothetical protein
MITIYEDILMNIIFGKAQIDSLPENKFIVLELDRISYGEHGRPDSAYCLVENVPITELPDVERNIEFHKQLILSYQQQEWQNCYNLIDQLRGKWGGDVDSFYSDLYSRVQRHENEELDSSWTGVINKTV